MTPPSTRTVPLERSFDRSAFRCGQPELERYIRKQALQDTRRRVAQVFVLPGEEAGQILGFYSLSAAAFSKGKLPPPEARSLPHYPVPAAIIGRLAVDSRFQGRGLGRLLLFDALWRIVAASETLGVYAVVVDAISPTASNFYGKYGFASFPDQPLRLFLPMKTVVRALAQVQADR